MPRLPRLNLPNIPQHVVQRGNNRQVTFFSDQDYIVYLDKLKEYAKKYKVAIHSYVLMTNHTHLLMTPETQTGVSQLMQSLGGITLDILIKLIIVRAHSGKVVINQR